MRKLKPDIYIVAVSGGVDSMVLLDMLVKQPARYLPSKKSTLVVAHFDHGIRSDSMLDAKLVKAVASQHDLVFEAEKGKLGPQASELSARIARYRFLYKVSSKYQAQAIVLAHHQDDKIETAILNIIRGTNYRGLGALRSHGRLLRPLLDMPKLRIYEYARENKLQWREDSTNQDKTYLRNYIRQEIVPRLTKTARSQLVSITNEATRLAEGIEQIFDDCWQASKPICIGRRQLTITSKSVNMTILAEALRRTDKDIELSRELLESIWWFSISATTGKQFLLKNIKISMEKDQVLIVERRQT